MTNNYRNLTSTELAWLAGLLQGEAEYGKDERVRSDTSDPTNDPPPPPLFVKIEMTEEDVMERVAKLVGKNVVPQKRPTTAGNRVYRVNITGREEVADLLTALLPYTVGQVRIQQIKELLALYDEYKTWLEGGGKSRQAARAARIGHAKRAAAKAEQKKRLEAEKKSLEE